VLDDCDVIIDVGGVYEPEHNRFDHHQRGFTEVFGHGYNTKLSSAGATLNLQQLPALYLLYWLAAACYYSVMLETGGWKCGSRQSSAAAAHAR
jgi:hypothetical protein